jgi:uncharacterized damage-inducible protein DinB
MNRIDHVRLMANYNAWMNGKLYAAASTLPTAELIANRNAFFGSLLGTLNHLVIADTIWLKRFAAHPAHPPALEPTPIPSTKIELDALPFPELDSLRARRTMLDRTLVEWTNGLSERDLDHVLHYANSRGDVADKSFFGLLMHFFNHQTHHRGQATTLLTQAGVDVGVTDFLVLVPDRP